MNYELVRQLREAGFPPGEAISVCHVPTLSELIEACGNTWTEVGLEKPARFSLSWDTYPDIEKGAWMATYLEEGGFQTGNIGYGDTPEEAVAGLWLVLNGKP
jgi:hypothetical protein